MKTSLLLLSAFWVSCFAWAGGADYSPKTIQSSSPIEWTLNIQGDSGEKKYVGEEINQLLLKEVTISPKLKLKALFKFNADFSPEIKGVRRYNERFWPTFIVGDVETGSNAVGCGTYMQKNEDPSFDDRSFTFENKDAKAIISLSCVVLPSTSKKSRK